MLQKIRRQKIVARILRAVAEETQEPSLQQMKEVAALACKIAAKVHPDPKHRCEHCERRQRQYA